MKRRVPCVTFVAWISSVPLHAQGIDTLALRAHTSVLAHDSMQGRETGMPGGHAAARYIAEQLDALGLEAPANGDHLQPVPLRRVRILQTSLGVLTLGDRTLEFGPGAFAWTVGGPASVHGFAGGATLVGTAAQAAISPTGDVNGRVVVVLGTMGDHAGPLARRWMAAGASGVLLLVRDADAFQAVREMYASRMLYVDAPVDEPHWQPDLPVVIGGPGVARALLGDRPPAGFGSEQAVAPVGLGRMVTITVRAVSEPVVAHNVAGLVRGSDPELRGRVVVYTAHYDHLGIGAPVDGDSIYNGFSDNAAGVAMLLAIAERMRDAPHARSMLFLFPTGEEKGLLGSAFWAASPLVPLERTDAVINLDAGAPPVPPVSWRFAGSETWLRTLAASVAEEHGWRPITGPARANSDHWPFLARGIPAVFVVPGPDWEDTSEQDRDRLRERWDRYHHAADHYHAEFPFAGLARYAELALEIGTRAANRH